MDVKVCLILFVIFCAVSEAARPRGKFCLRCRFSDTEVIQWCWTVIPSDIGQSMFSAFLMLANWWMRKFDLTIPPKPALSTEINQACWNHQRQSVVCSPLSRTDIYHQVLPWPLEDNNLLIAAWKMTDLFSLQTLPRLIFARYWWR